jgi:hypothetical protein
LEDDYVVFSAIMDPQQFGWPGRRKRYLGVAFHKTYVLQTYSTLDNVLPIFERIMTQGLDWQVFFVAENEADLDGELDIELAWAGNRKTSRAEGRSMEELKALPGGPFLASLNNMEAGNARVYPATHLGMLNQTPERGFGISSQPGHPLHTLIKNAALHFSKHHGRWLTGSEMLIANGFPVLRRHANPRGSAASLCSFAGSVRTREQRDRQTMAGQSGNTINVVVAGVVEFFFLLYCRPLDEIPFVQRARLRAP